MKLTRRDGIRAIFLGVVHSFNRGLLAQWLPPGYRNERRPMWIYFILDDFHGIRVRKGSREIEITRDEIWNALAS